jgi:peroxiredoxin
MALAAPAAGLCPDTCKSVSDVRLASRSYAIWRTAAGCSATFPAQYNRTCVESIMLKQGDQVPRFTITTTDGREIRYLDLWQHSNLLLVALSPDTVASAARYIDGIRKRLSDLPADDTTCIVTSDQVEGLPAPGTLVADRWGEVRFARRADSVEDLPAPQDLAEWVQHVQHACPECEGEAR